MKLPFFEIIDSNNEILILLIEDPLDQKDQLEINNNYQKLLSKTNQLLNQIEDYLKFESIHSLKECIKIREECKKHYRYITTDKGNGSIYSNLIHDPDFNFKPIIYDDSDKLTKIKGFNDILKASTIKEHIQQKENVEIEHINLFGKPGKGQKSCKKCKKIIGARSMTCKYCKQDCK